LTAGPDRIGLYTQSHGEYVELSLAGDIIGRWPIADGDCVRSALSSAGDVYVSTFRAPSGSRTFRLDRTTGVWVPAGTKIGLATFLGTDGLSLVMSRSLPELVWVSVR
jgi:hypothetical protein